MDGALNTLYYCFAELISPKIYVNMYKDPIQMQNKAYTRVIQSISSYKTKPNSLGRVHSSSHVLWNIANLITWSYIFDVAIAMVAR